MDKYLRANRALWDEWTGINYRSDLYEVEDLHIKFLHEFTFCE